MESNTQNNPETSQVAARPRYDRRRLKEDIKASIARARALKTSLRSSHEGRVAEAAREQRALAKEKWIATMLHIAAARSRGRQHRPGWIPQPWQESQMAVTLAEYVIE